MKELDRAPPEPIKYSRENEEMADTADDLPALGALLEAATPATVLLRRTRSEFKIWNLVILQELFIFGIGRKGDRLLCPAEIHGGRRRGGGESAAAQRGFIFMTTFPKTAAVALRNKMADVIYDGTR